MSDLLELRFKSTNLPQTNDPQEIQKGHLDLLDKVNQVNISTNQAQSSAGNALSVANAAAAAAIPWSKMVQYTPTFTGFGTVTNINFWWSRVGNILKITGTFTAGVVIATIAMVTLPTGLNSDSTIVSTLSVSGIGGSNNDQYLFVPLIRSGSVNFVTFGVPHVGSFTILQELNATSFLTNSSNVSLKFEIPIQGWN